MNVCIPKPVSPEVQDLLDLAVDVYERRAAVPSTWTQLGAGHFSRVYTDGKYAIKLGGIKDGSDSGGIYARWCQENQHLELVPKIHAAEYDLSEDGTGYVVIMDVLQGYDNVDEETYERARATAECIERNRYDEDEVFDEYDSAPFPSVAEFLHAFQEIRDCGGLDLHNENYMFTADGVMQITDPMSWAY